MKYLFDASAIFRAIKENKIVPLTGNYTAEIARYELGNIVWKDYFLQAKITKEEAVMMIKAITHTLSIMEVLQIVSNEEAIFETSAQFKITFYDASYAYLARANELQLVTEDRHLIKNLTPTIKALMLNEIAQENEKKSS